MLDILPPDIQGKTQSHKIKNLSDYLETLYGSINRSKLEAEGDGDGAKYIYWHHAREYGFLEYVGQYLINGETEPYLISQESDVLEVIEKSGSNITAVKVRPGIEYNFNGIFAVYPSRLVGAEKKGTVSLTNGQEISFAVYTFTVDDVSKINVGDFLTHLQTTSSQQLADQAVIRVFSLGEQMYAFAEIFIKAAEYSQDFELITPHTFSFEFPVPAEFAVASTDASSSFRDLMKLHRFKPSIDIEGSSVTVTNYSYLNLTIHALFTIY